MGEFYIVDRDKDWYSCVKFIKKRMVMVNGYWIIWDFGICVFFFVLLLFLEDILCVLCIVFFWKLLLFEGFFDVLWYWLKKMYFDKVFLINELIG